MAAIRVIRFLNKLLDVSSNGPPDQGIPIWRTSASKYVVDTIAAGGGTQTAISGISVSDTVYTSGTVRFSGSGNVTLQSGTGQMVNISVDPQSVQPETQTFIGGISASNTDFTSGTVRITGLGAITVGTNTGQRIDLSVDPQSQQTQDLFDLTLDGNTSGALALVSSGTLTLAGGNRITLSQNGNAITISGANQSVQPETQTFLGGLKNSQTTYTSGTVGLSELGAITIRSTTGNQYQFSVNSQTAQTQNLFDLTLSGNTDGALALVSSGTATLAGGSNITLSQAGNAITIIGASAAADTQTAISGIANSQTTYTSGTVSLSELGAITIRSTTGNQFQFSVNSQSVQPETQTFVGGVGNSQTTYTSGTINLSVEGGALTIRSTTGQAFRFSVSQSVQPETQTAISGIANSQTTYTSGTVSLSELGAITIRSTTGNQYQFSVNSQTVQTQNLIDVTLAGNTSGALALVSSGTLTLAGGNNITLSQAGNAVTISGPNTAAFSAGVSTGGNTAGSTGVTGTRLVFAGSTPVSLSQSTDANGGTISINAPATSSLVGTGTGVTITTNGSTISISVPGFQAGVSNLGNTAGSTGATATRLILAGSNMISLSQSTDASGGTVTINATQSVQPETQTFVAGIANSQTTYTSGTIGLSELGAITIRSTTGNQYQLSVNSQTNQAGTVFAASNTFGTSSGTYDARTLSIAGDGIISIAASNSGWRISATQSVQTQDVLSVGVSTGGNTAGNTTVNTGSRMVFVGTNMVSISEGTAAGATTLTFDATNQNLSLGVSSGGNTSGNTTVNTGSRFVLVGSNNITLSQGTAAGATTVTISGPATTPSFSGGVSNVGNTAGSTGVTGTRQVLVGTNAVSLSQSTDANGGTVSINVATTPSFSAGASNVGNTAGSTGVTGTRLVIVGTNNISLSQSTDANGGTLSINHTLPSFSGGVSNVGNTAGATGVSGTRLVLVGTNNITLSQTTDANGATVSFSAPSPGAAQYSIGVSTGGNTAGSTGVTGTRIVFVGSGNNSLSQATDATGATITILDTMPSFSGGVSTAGNTAGSTGATGTRLVFVGTNNISLSQSTDANGGTISVNDTLPSFSAGVSNLGNTAGSTGVTGTRLVIVGTNGISLSQSTDASGGTITVNTPQEGTISMWPEMHQSTGFSAINTSSLYFSTAGTTARTTMTMVVFPMAINQNLSVNMTRMLLQHSYTSATTTANFSFTAGHSLGIYTLTGGSISLLSSFSNKQQFSYANAANSTNASMTFSYSAGSGNQVSTSLSLSTNNAGAAGLWGSFNLGKLYPMGSGAGSLSAGQYFGVWGFTSSTGGQNLASVSGLGVQTLFAQNQREIGKNTASVSAAYPLMGQVSATQTDTALPVSFATSDISLTGTAGGLVDRFPLVHFVSQF